MVVVSEMAQIVMVKMIAELVVAFTVVVVSVVGVSNSCSVGSGSDNVG